MPSQEGVLCLPAESQVYGADTRICDTTQGELNRTKGEHQHSRRTCICSFLQDRTEAAEAVLSVLCIRFTTVCGRRICSDTMRLWTQMSMAYLDGKSLKKRVYVHTSIMPVSMVLFVL